jgi:hypothetical protein
VESSLQSDKYVMQETKGSVNLKTKIQIPKIKNVSAVFVHLPWKWISVTDIFGLNNSLNSSDSCA